MSVSGVPVDPAVGRPRRNSFARIRRPSRISSTPATDPFAGLLLYDCNYVPVTSDPRTGETLAWDVLPPRKVSTYFGTSEGVKVTRAEFERLLAPRARRLGLGDRKETA
jgi:hypothetical protein